jgi:hypothetical protein
MESLGTLKYFWNKKIQDQLINIQCKGLQIESKILSITIY